MDKQAQSSKLSLGVFDHLDSMCLAVGALLDLHFSVDQLGIISLDSTLERMLQPPQCSEEHWKAVCRIVSEAAPGDGVARPQDIFISPTLAPLYTGLAGVRTIPTDRLDPGRTLRNADDIDALVRTGTIALGVATLTRAEQWRSVRILLARSILPVMTHELGDARR